MDEKIKIIQQVLGKGYRNSEEHLFHCPYCKHSKRKFSVNFEKNVFKCWVCDTRGRDLRRIVRKFGTFKQKARWDELTNRVNINDFSNIFADLNKDEVEEIDELPKEFKSLAN